MSPSKVLSGLSPATRSAVLTEWRKNGRTINWNLEDAASLAKSIFAVEDLKETDLASRGVGPTDKRMRDVRELNRIRNAILDDLGENEQGNRYWCSHNDDGSPRC